MLIRKQFTISGYSRVNGAAALPTYQPLLKTQVSALDPCTLFSK